MNERLENKLSSFCPKVNGDLRCINTLNHNDDHDFQPKSDFRVRNLDLLEATQRANFGLIND